MTIKVFLAVSLQEAPGRPLIPGSVELVGPGGARTAVATTAGSSRLADITALGAGDYKLEVAIAGRPKLVFSLRLTRSGDGPVVKFTSPQPKCCMLRRQQVKAAAGAKGDITYASTFTLGGAHREVVLVAGWDYYGGADYRLMTRTWRRDHFERVTYRAGKRASLSTQVVDDATVVTTFDFKRGKRTREIKGVKGWHTMDDVLQGSVAPHTATPHKRATNATRRQTDDSISIDHVYTHIADIGAAAPGALHAFQIFSHAWDGGPVLANTSSGAGDKDGRTGDFVAGGRITRLADFQAAFASGADVKIWGCLAVTVYRRAIRAAARAPTRATPITYDDPAAAAPVTRTAAEIETLIRGRMSRAYMGRLSDAIGVDVRGAPPGMGANLRQASRRHYFYVDQKTYKVSYTWLEKTLSLTPDDTGYIAY